MSLPTEVIEELRVAPGGPADLAGRSTAATTADWLGALGRAHPKDVAEHDLEGFRSALGSAQELLFASDSWALLVVLQALDAAGKDGTIAHVMTGVNPQGCSVTSFKVPSPEELAHDFLWRFARAMPRRGQIGIFNRSYYEEVLVTRVHPDLLAAEHIDPPVPAEAAAFWRSRLDDINAFEEHLSRSRTRIVKIFLHLSKAEQRTRLLARLDDPHKQWKFSPADLAERRYFGQYQTAYEEAISATSTEWAPWYVVPADHKYASRALVGGILVHTVERLGLRLPELDEVQRAALEVARRTLSLES